MTDMERLAALEAIIPSLATKADLGQMEVSLIKWYVATAIAIVTLTVGLLSLVLNISLPKLSASAVPTQPIIINVPSAAQAPAPAASR